MTPQSKPTPVVSDEELRKRVAILFNRAKNTNPSGRSESITDMLAFITSYASKREEETKLETEHTLDQKWSKELERKVLEAHKEELTLVLNVARVFKRQKAIRLPEFIEGINEAGKDLEKYYFTRLDALKKQKEQL